MPGTREKNTSRGQKRLNVVIVLLLFTYAYELAKKMLLISLVFLYRLYEEGAVQTLTLKDVYFPPWGLPSGAHLIWSNNLENP